jgi:hypothetical protein
MTHRIWTRVFAASLILLGDGVFASEINHSDDLVAVTGDNIFQISLPALLDESGTNWQPLIASVNTEATAYNQTSLTITAVSHSVPDTHTYHPLNPRAPPIPAD